MRRPVSPQEKKALSYKLDHYTLTGENDKSWRRKRPLKKAWGRRDVRRKSRQSVVHILDGGEIHEQADAKLHSIRSRKVHNWGVMSLEEIVTLRRSRRRNGPNKTPGSHDKSKR